MATPERTSQSNPFASPIKSAITEASSDTIDIQAHQDKILTTACLLLKQLRELESICASTEERVQRKRLALQDLENLLSDSSRSRRDNPDSPARSANTPVSHRFIRLKSPRLRGLFDLRGPGRLNHESVQSEGDYSPENPAQECASRVDDRRDGNDEWVDDDEEAPLCPFGDEHASKEEEKGSLKTPTSRLVYEPSAVSVTNFAADVDTEKQRLLVDYDGVNTADVDSPLARKAGVSSQVLARKSSNRRHPSIRSTKTAKGTMRRSSWKRSIMASSMKAKGGTRPVSQNNVEEGAKKPKKGRWSIYSVCSELSLNARHNG